MATTTVTHQVAVHAAPHTHSQTPVQPASSCSHLLRWIGSDPDTAADRLEAVLPHDSSFPASKPTKASLKPPCSTCGTHPLRSFVCLACGVPSCGRIVGPSHAHQHAHHTQHKLAWDVRSRSLYCFECGEYVRHQVIDRFAAAQQLVQDEGRAEADVNRATKRKRVSMKKWELMAPVPAPSSGSALAARGIRNLGNSCYMSVVLQTFLANPYLRTHFLGDRHNRLLCDKSRNGEPCLSCELDLLFSEASPQYSVDPTPLAPTRFLHSFWQSSLDATGYAQQDAHEFLISSLNLLHSASPSHTDNPALSCPCVVHRTFSGELRSKITCGRCHHQSETLEPFLDLSLDIRDRATGKLAETLSDCLNSFTAPEQLPSKYSCAACGDGVPSASKRLSLKTLPQVLCVQLKRFEITSAAHKLDTPVRYPLKLDMAPYLTTHLEYPASYKPSDAQRYNLMAVIAHEGTLSQGHYTAYVRGSDDFFAIDDDKVRRARISEVLAAKAYLVVYSRA
ncbi:hypothetical protein DMC30DRAFT_417711 [Rhodotorula diobovata]|uniref:Ubiquitin carboxyl-terminal hydrolase n=1 Tax=Rhodotorula diobovata TaxID=5288 RepID=A0A5C5FTR6_9BASI|nr:hypothetical protein DMC30DRAFT_417711 [Rhodotorula diobovata]